MYSHTSLKPAAIIMPPCCSSLTSGAGPFPSQGKAGMGLKFSLLGLSMVMSMAFVACGPPVPPAAPEGFLGGPSVVVVAPSADSPEPWLLEWDGDARKALSDQISTGIALVRYEEGRLELLPRCSISGGYDSGGGGSRPVEEKSISSEGELYGKLGIKLIKAEARFEKGERWDLKFVVADLRTANAESVIRSELPSGCEAATHYVRTAFFGAYVLDTGVERNVSGSVGAAVPVLDVEVGGGKKRGAAIKKSDGVFDECIIATTPTDSPACSGILKIGIAPIQ